MKKNFKSCLKTLSQTTFSSADSFSNWCAATALSHALFRNKDLKEQLLRVQLATGVGNSLCSACYWGVKENLFS